MSSKIFPATSLGARACVVGAAALFSTGGGVVKGLPLDPWWVASLRSAVAALVFALVLGRRLRVRPRAWLLVGVPYACTLVLFVVANAWTTAGQAVFLQSTAPLYVLLLGPRLLREPFQRRDLVTLGLFGVGLGVLLADSAGAQVSAPHPGRGALVAAITGVTWAATVMGLRLLARGSSDPSGVAGVAETDRPDEGADQHDHSVTTLGAILGGNLLACLGGVVGGVASDVPIPASGALLDALPGILWLGAVQIALAYLLLERGLRRVPAAEAALILLLEPVLSPVWAFLWHGERMGPLALGGAALVVCGSLARLRSAP